MQRKILKPLRIFAALLFFISTAFLFSSLAAFLPPDITGSITWIQFIPSALKALAGLTLASAGFILVLIVTLLSGRVYCSFVCPLGLILDIFSRAREYTGRFFIRFAGKGNRFGFHYIHPLNAISFYILLAAIIAFFFHNIFLINVFDPFSLGGKIFSVFRGSLLIGLITVCIFGLFGFFSGRRYCNMVCPLGMFLGLVSRFAVLRISVSRKSCKSCGECEEACKGECIDHKTHRVDFSRCVGCMNCISACSHGAIKYRLSSSRDKAGKAAPPADASRRRFMKKAAGGAASLTLLIIPYRFPSEREIAANPAPVMPPGAISMRHFKQKCIACQLCISSCPTRVLVPSLLEYGISGVFQPKLDFTRSFCKYDCNRCLEVCPTGAIRPMALEEKQKTQIGIAMFEKNICLVAAEHKPCAKCAEHCPVKAIELLPYLGDLKLPKVHEDLCNGCGACEYYCPVRPDRAISVEAYSVQQLIYSTSSLPLAL